MLHATCEEPLGKGEQQIQRNLIEILFSLILSQHLERLYPTQIGINTHTHTHLVAVSGLPSITLSSFPPPTIPTPPNQTHLGAK